MAPVDSGLRTAPALTSLAMQPERAVAHVPGPVLRCPGGRHPCRPPHHQDVVETWANARDSGDWDAFRACWHDDGYMMATWFQGPKEDFIRVSQEGVARGVNILHFTGGCRITLRGTRAIAQTRMTIMQRGMVDGALCDVSCIGRFYDFSEKRDGRWAIVLRQPIYEKDRLDPVEPGVPLTLDRELLGKYPE